MEDVKVLPKRELVAQVMLKVGTVIFAAYINHKESEEE